MALLLLGKTVCPLCGKIIWDEGAISFPHFVPNTMDPLYKFSDSSFHADCLKNDPLGDKALEFSDEFFSKISSENRICIVSDARIESVDDYLFIDLLTSNENEELYNFNFITINKNNIGKWDRKDRFLIVARKFIEENKWDDFGSFRYLDRLIDRFEKA